MSQMKELYDKVAKDSALQATFSWILLEAEKAGQPSNPLAQQETEKKLQAFAKVAGYEVSIEEMQSFFQGMETQATGELSDEELDQVAGGKVNPWTVVATVLTLGIVCAAYSILDAANGISNCESFFRQT